MVRNIPLIELGINKPDDGDILLNENTEPDENFMTKQQKEDLRAQYVESEVFYMNLGVIYAIRELKAQVTGDLYADFYKYGEPADRSYSAHNDKNFKVRLYTQEDLLRDEDDNQSDQDKQ